MLKPLLQTLNSDVKDLWVSANVYGAVANNAQFEFRVGANKDQIVGLTIANFGKDGDMTGAITSDKYSTHILTTAASNEVLQSVNQCLDKISVERANMGAVIKRCCKLKGFTQSDRGCRLCKSIDTTGSISNKATSRYSSIGASKFEF